MSDALDDHDDEDIAMIPLGKALALRRLGKPPPPDEAAETNFRWRRSMDLQDTWAMRIAQKKAVAFFERLAERLHEQKTRAIEAHSVLRELGADDDANFVAETIALLDEEAENAATVAAEIAAES